MNTSASSTPSSTNLHPRQVLQRVIEGKQPLVVPESHEHTPSTPEYFADCNRLLRQHPEWFDRMIDIGMDLPSWMPFADEWPMLKAWLDDCTDSGGYITRDSYNQARESFNKLQRRLDYLRVRVIWKNYRRQG